MSFSSISAFGGTLKIGGKEYSVRGRTYRKIAEQQTWWMSQCFCPVTELRRFLHKNEAFMDKDFITQWLKKGRMGLIVDLELQSRILSSFAARRFDIWQACRDDGLRLEELDSFLDELDGIEIAEFLEEADRKMALANGAGELEYLANCFSRTISAPGGGRPVEAMIAQVCVRNKNRMLLSEILDSTPAAVRQFFEDPEHVVDDADAERNLHPSDKLSQKRFGRIYENMASCVLLNKRIDSYLPPEPKVKTNEKPATE